MKTIHVIGAGVEGQEGFSGRALELIDQADLLIGAERLLALFPDFAGETFAVGSDLSGVLPRLKQAEGHVVILSSGDPLFFGLGRDLLRNLPKDDIEFVPNVSSVQYAFAKIREPWDDAIFVSAAGRGLKSAVDQIVAHDKAALLTDEINTPRAIARELIERGRDGYAVYLCENLGAAEEKITQCDLRKLLEIDVAALNLLILIKEYEAGGEGVGPGLGIPDDEFASGKN